MQVHFASFAAISFHCYATTGEIPGACSAPKATYPLYESIAGQSSEYSRSARYIARTGGRIVSFFYNEQATGYAYFV